MSNSINVTSKNFKEVVNQGVTLVDFRADWCPPCVMMDSVLSKVEANDKYSDVKFAKVNVDDNQDLASEFSITGIPTFLFMKNGEIIKRETGLKTKNNIESMLDQLV